MMRCGKRVMSVMLSLALLGTSVSLTGCGSSKKAGNGELNLFIWIQPTIRAKLSKVSDKLMTLKHS